MFTDTHTHLYLKDFEHDREEIFLRAFEKGVNRFFLPNIDAQSIDPLLQLCKEYSSCFPMLGLHPCSVKEDYGEQLEHLKKYLSREHFYAIGEIGIDLFWDKSFLMAQQDAFYTQVNWAKKRMLPVVIHSRDSFDIVMEILKSEKSAELRGVFHCFTGTENQAREALELGFYLGIGGVLTYKNSGLDKVLASVGIQHLVLETDSPYLAPVPYRGKRNESSYLYEVAKKLSEIYNLPVEEIAAVTTQNSIKLFGI